MARLRKTLNDYRTPLGLVNGWRDVKAIQLFRLAKRSNCFESSLNISRLVLDEEILYDL